MHWSPLLLVAYAGLAAAHGDHALPKLVGGRKFLSELRAARNLVANRPAVAARDTSSIPEVRELEDRSPDAKTVGPRQVGGTAGQCGAGYGSCARGYCCSPEG